MPTKKTTTSKAKAPSASAKSTAPKTARKPVQKSSTSTTQSSTSPKKTAPAKASKAPAKKTATATKKPVAKTTTTTPTKTASVKKETVPVEKVAPVKTSTKKSDHIQIMGILHVVGGILGTWGWLAVLIYYLVSKDSFTSRDREVFVNIMNFSLSFAMYLIISGILVLMLIGFVLIPITWVVWCIILVIMSINHIQGESYDPPLTIRFIKK